jgi:hypothetical protein
MSKSRNNQGHTVPTTPSAASRVQSAVARTHGGVVPKDSYAGRLQGAAIKNYGKSGGK